MTDETQRNIQLTLAVQALESRVTSTDRSTGALRELLRQKLGTTGIMELIEALENLGAGSHALLEVPVAMPSAINNNNNYSNTNNSSNGSLIDREDTKLPPIYGTKSITDSQSGQQYSVNNSNNNNNYYNGKNDVTMRGGNSSNRNNSNFDNNETNAASNHSDYTKAIENTIYRS